MTASLHLDPVGSGKTALALDLLLDTLRRGSSLPRVWALTATARQSRYLRDRIAARGGPGKSYFNIDFFIIYELNRRLLHLAATPVRGINQATRTTLLRQLMRQMMADGKLDYFGVIAEKRGFIEAIADFINELKRNGINEEDFSRAAVSAKEKEIAAIYLRYQTELKRRGLVDREGEGWLALAQLRRNPRMVSDVDLLLVDGFDQFTPVQARTLAQMALSIKRVDITLTLLPGKAGEISRRGAMTRDRLQDAFKELDLPLELKPIPARDEGRHTDLAALSRGIFQDIPRRECSPALALLEAPDEDAEVRSVLRRVKRQLRDGARPGDIMIATRDWERYAPRLRQIGAEFGLPIAFHRSSPLLDNPLVRALVELAELSPHFRRRDLLDLLRSPYLISGLDTEDIDLLDCRSRARLLLRGAKDDWLAIFPPDDGRCAAMARKLSRFIDAATPPEAAAFADHVAWLEGLLAHDASDETPVTLCIPTGEEADNQLAERDGDALRSLRRALRELVASRSITDSPHEAPAMLSWAENWSDIKYALQHAAAADSTAARRGRILATTVPDARGLPHESLAILGLAEGGFPAAPSEDPLFLDSERRELRRRGILLETQAERADDRGLFVELLSLPRHSLTLSRPTYQDGKPLLASYLWRAVLDVFPLQPIETIPAGKVVALDEAASPHELMLSAVEASGSLGGAESWLSRHSVYGDLWRRIMQGKDVELKRFSRLPVDAYSGKLERPRSLSLAREKLGPERIFSASQLKDYGQCGFRFFATRLLKLEDISEPETGYDLLQLGSLNHKILERTYKRIQERDLVIHDANRDEALAIFEDVADKLLERAPVALGFHPGPVWEAEAQMLRRRLRAVVSADFSPDNPFNTIAESRQVHALEKRFDDVVIDLPDGEALRLRGFIDRVDEAGGKLYVVDYKTGTTAINRRQMQEGRDFQMLTYVLSLAQLLAREGASEKAQGGLFWHLRNLKASGVFDVENEDDLAAVEAALEHIAAYLGAARAGSFPVKPNGSDASHCASYCEFTRFCRVSVTNRNKAAVN